MKTFFKKTLILLMVTAMSIISFTACNKKDDKSDTKNDTNTTETSDITIKVGSLKGPTSMGLVNLMVEDEAGTSDCDYDFTIYTQADEIVAEIVKGNLDIATVPANISSVLYQKTEKGISVIDINTLGVLYVVESGDSIKNISDLKGKTIYLTGKGTSPDFVLQYLLSENGLSTDDVTLEYKSEATEVAALLAEDENAIGLLPQPFVTTAMMNNENLNIALDLTKEWKNASGDNLVTGVTIVRNEFLKDNASLVKTFIKEHNESVQYGKENLDETSERIEKYGIIKSAVAKQAYEYCNIVCIDGEDMKSALSVYLNVLYDYEPSTVGGSLPDDNFYATVID